MTKRAFVFVLLLGWSALLRAADLASPMILVADPQLGDGIFSRTVLVVTPLGGDQHLGFIVNRPTTIALGKLFPDDAPSQKVLDPVYLGGPVDAQVIFALVRRTENPGGSALQMLPGLFAAFDAPTVDRIIQSDPAHARFFAGLVVWRAGELRSEIEQGAWYTMAPDADLAMRTPQGLWEELVERAQHPARFAAVNDRVLP
jgi:putative transcriptional regulator